MNEQTDSLHFPPLQVAQNTSLMTSFTCYYQFWKSERSHFNDN